MSFFYASWCFNAWVKKNNRANRSAIGRATKVTLYVSGLVWLIGFCACYGVNSSYYIANY